MSMSIESLWYSAYGADGRAPHCARLSRQPFDFQWGCASDIAISFARGEAGYRNTFVSLTREQYWYWPHPLSNTGWWLIPDRVARRVFALYRAAATQACREHRGSTESDQIASILLRWQHTGAWRKHALITPRRELIAAVIPRWSSGKRGRRSNAPESTTTCECGRRWQDSRAAKACPRLLPHSANAGTNGRLVYSRSEARSIRVPPGRCWAECDNGHRWIIPREPHDEDLDTCPRCGEYWQ